MKITDIWMRKIIAFMQQFYSTLHHIWMSYLCASGLLLINKKGTFNMLLWISYGCAHAQWLLIALNHIIICSFKVSVPIEGTISLVCLLTSSVIKHYLIRIMKIMRFIDSHESSYLTYGSQIPALDMTPKHTWLVFKKSHARSDKTYENILCILINKLVDLINNAQWLRHNCYFHFFFLHCIFSCDLKLYKIKLRLVAIIFHLFYNLNFIFMYFF